MPECPRTPLPIPHSAVEGIAWPALAGGMPPLFLAALQQLEYSQYLPPAELRARQFRQLSPLADGGFDLVVLQMVLHYAEDPRGALAEAARVLAPGGRLVIVDLAAHGRTDVMTRLAHRWPGFTDAGMDDLLAATGLAAAAAVPVPGPLDVRLWPAARIAASPTHRDFVSETA